MVNINVVWLVYITKVGDDHLFQMLVFYAANSYKTRKTMGLWPHLPCAWKCDPEKKVDIRKKNVFL